MVRLLKFLLFVLVIGFVGLVGYAYLGNMAPQRNERIEPVTLDAQ